MFLKYQDMKIKTALISEPDKNKLYQILKKLRKYK